MKEAESTTKAKGTATKRAGTKKTTVESAAVETQVSPKEAVAVETQVSPKAAAATETQVSPKEAAAPKKKAAAPAVSVLEVVPAVCEQPSENSKQACEQPAASESAKEVCFEQVAKRAYELWLSKDCQHGTDVENWLEAEIQVKAEATKK